MLTTLIHAIDPDARLIRARPLQGGISAQMTAVELVDGNGHTQRWTVRCLSERTLRRNPHAAADQFRMLQLLHPLDIPTPAPIHLQPPCLVMSHIDGKPVYAPANIADFAAQAARQLAAIHQVNGRADDLTFLPDQSTRLAALLDDEPARLNDALDERLLRDTLRPVWPLPNRNTAVLLHGDFWPGNWLWQNGRFAAIIDWEDAERGDPLSDFAISRLDMRLIFGRGAQHAFTQAYLSANPIDAALLPYWDLFAALRAAWGLHEWADGWPALGRPDITPDSLHENHRAFVAETVAHLHTVKDPPSWTEPSC